MHLGGNQKFAAYAAAVVMVLAMGFIGGQCARPTAALSVEPISGTAPKVVARDEKTVSAPLPEKVPPPVVVPQEMAVAVAGAVKKSGLYHLPPDSRIDDAIKAAGGAKGDADLDAINVAAKVADSDQVYVPYKKRLVAERSVKPPIIPKKFLGGELKPTSEPITIAPLQPASSPPPSSSKAKSSGPVSLNTGTEADFETLPGVGKATAAKIVEYRTQNGAFTSIDQVQSIKGIGAKKFEKMRPFLQL